MPGNKNSTTVDVDTSGNANVAVDSFNNYIQINAERPTEDILSDLMSNREILDEEKRDLVAVITRDGGLKAPPSRAQITLQRRVGDRMAAVRAAEFVLAQRAERFPVNEHDIETFSEIYTRLGTLMDFVLFPFYRLLRTIKRIMRVRQLKKIVSAFRAGNTQKPPLAAATPPPAGFTSAPQTPAAMTPPPAGFASAPHLCFYVMKGAAKTLYREAQLTQKIRGDLGAIHKSLAMITYKRDAQNHLSLKIGGRAPTALRRNGQQRVLSQTEKAAVAILPGDALRIDDWEIDFKESPTLQVGHA